MYKTVLYLMSFLPLMLFSQSYPAPEKTPAKVFWDGQNLTMTYNGTVLLQGRLENPESVEYSDVLEDLSDKAISQVVQLVFEWYLTGKFSTRSIAEKLNNFELTLAGGSLIRPRQKGGPGRTEPGPFTRDMIRDILRRMAYTRLFPEAL